MRRKLLQYISETSIMRSLTNTPAPRWITYAVDLLIVAFCSLYLLLAPPDRFAPFPSALQISYLLIVGSYALMNLITGSYKCIVRFSVTEDMFKVFWYVLLSSALVCAFSVGFSLFSSAHHMLVSIVPVAIIAGMSLSLMMLVRISVKYLYNVMTTVRSPREPVIVLGSAINSLSLANMLRNEIEGHYEPVALLSLNPELKPGKVNGIVVEKFDETTVGDLFDSYNCHTLVFLQTHLDLMRSGFADAFIQNHIALRVLNQIDEFDANSDTDEANISGHVRDVKIEDLLGRPVIHTDNSRITGAIAGSTVLITGAAGSIGSEIVRQVAQCGAGKIILLDQAETPMHDMQLEMEKSFPSTDIGLFVADVQNRRRLERIFKRHRPRFVYHAAAYKHVPMMERNPSEAVLTNVMGTKNLADLSLQYGVEKFVMVSTDKAVNPTNIMGTSKRLAEIYVQSLFNAARKRRGDGNCTQFITTRFGNVLGSNGSVIPLFRSQIEAGGPVTVTHRDIIRYFMTIQEACSLVLEAGCMGSGGEIFLFDMGQPVKIYDLACRMILLAGLRPGEDIRIVETGLRPGEKLYEELLNDEERTLPTGNKKIMIAKVRKYNFDEVSRRIDELIALASEGEIHEMVRTMKEIVPEYISNNSEFESIDSELRHSRDLVQEHQPEPDHEYLSDVVLRNIGSN